MLYNFDPQRKHDIHLNTYILALSKYFSFFQELIYGPFQKGSDDGKWPYVGRGPEKYFLYEIVANKVW